MAYLVFPNLGNYTIALASDLSCLGLEAWVSTATSPDAMKLGIEAAPESACLPFKAHLGLFIEAANAGVEYALMVNSIGACRLRYYRYLLEKILKDLGLKIHLFSLGYDGIKPPFIRYFDPDLLPFVKSTVLAFRKIKVIDIIELKTWRTRPLEIRPGNTSRVMYECLHELNVSKTSKETLALSRTIPARFSAIPVDKGRNPLKVGLIGEVSVLRDKFLNHNVENILGNLGVEVRNFFLLGAEIRNIFHIELGNKNTRKYLAKLARPYLKYGGGGHALESVAHTIRCAHEGYDGMVHLCPAGCMPEISVRPILRRVSLDMDIPVLQCSFDEHTSSGGVTTRLEAFVDVLLERRKKKSGSEKVQKEV